LSLFVLAASRFVCCRCCYALVQNIRFGVAAVSLLANADVDDDDDIFNAN
jgi:hypothetical protein